MRQFRSFYKERVRQLKDSNRNEHFIGTENWEGESESTFGFFDIYHGDKEKLQTEGIEGFLEGFLDMARDAQAVYEFLQNAVDAGSTRFAMRWGPDPDGSGDYLLVLNNGKQFDFAAVRSILNVGVSTKDAAQHTIGKFGIGFKLAHRLVGQDNGLAELMNRLYGPILFSWRNNELHQLASASGELLPTPTQQTYTAHYREKEKLVSISEQDPWLFKILITNFPCQPGETIRDAHYRETNSAFDPIELSRLSRWLAHYKEQIPWEEYGEGSLFFIRLGPGKDQHLADERLEEGVKFSLAILNYTSPGQQMGRPGLRYVQLNNSSIERAPLNFESVIIKRETADYRYVRFGIPPDNDRPLTETEVQQMDKDADIELLLGFALDHEQAANLFENAPNFYLYFPLSEELHKLKFVLHSNAFYKGSARTSLHIGTSGNYSLNERLLTVFAQRLIERLATWSSSKDLTERQRFLAIYAAILLSEESAEASRTWINKPLVQPLHAALPFTIPVLTCKTVGDFEVMTTTDQVRLRLTKLPIDPEVWGLPYRWFYWSEHSTLSLQAARQLRLSSFTIIDALRLPQAVGKLNALMHEDSTWRTVLLEEINQELRINSEAAKIPEVRTALQTLRLFEFPDGIAHNWDELQHDDSLADHLIVFDRIEPLRDLLSRVGFVLSNSNTEQLYPSLHTLLRHVSQSTYLNDYVELNRYLSRRLAHNTFNKEEKLRVLRILAQAERGADQRKDRAEVLKLFRNQGGHIVALQNITKENFGEAWLNRYCLHNDEHDDAVIQYLVSSRNDILERVIVPLWDIIADDSYVRSVARNFYKKVVELQLTARQKFNLSDKRVVLLNGKFERVSTVLLHGPELAGFTEQEYAVLRQVLETHFGRVIPDSAVVDQLSETPFSVPRSDFKELLLTKPIILTIEQTQLLARLGRTQGFDLTQKHVWEAHASADHVVLRPRSEVTDERQVWSDSPGLTAYLQKFHPACIIAPNLAELRETITLKEAALLRFVLNEWDGIDTPQATALASLVLEQDDQAKLHYLARLGRLEWGEATNSSLPALHWAARVALGVGGSETAAKDAFAQVVWLKPDIGEAFALHAATETSGDLLQLVLTGINQPYEIRLSSLFPEKHGQQAAAVEAAVGKLLTNYPGVFDDATLWTLFGRTEQPAPDAVIARLQQHHAEVGYLENGSQLALALLACKSGRLTGYPWKLRQSTGAVITWQCNWAAAEGFPFFADKTYLAEDYCDAARLLRLTKTEAAFETPEANLYLWPVLRQQKFEGPNWQTDIEENNHPALLNELLDYVHTPLLITGPQPWPDIFGFDPAKCVMPMQRLEPEEAAPRQWADWRNKASDPENRKRRNTLFASLGLQLGFSPVCRLRTALLDESTSEEIKPGEIEQIPPFLLRNTLILVHERQPSKIYNLTSLQGELLRRTVTALPDDIQADAVPWPIATAHSGGYRLFYFEEGQEDAFYFSSSEADELARNQHPKLSEIVAITDVQVFDATAFGIRPNLIECLGLLRLDQEVDDVALEEQAEEWQEPFYLDWRQDYPGFSIQRVEFIPVNSILAEHVVRQVRDVHKIHTCGKAAYVPRAIATTEAIRQLQEWAGWEAAAATLAQRYAHQRQRLADLLDEVGLMGNPELLSRVDLLRKELEAEANRRKLKENLGSAQYSFGWFRDFIELWALQSEDGDHTAPEKDISFARVVPSTESSRLIELCEPSRLITPTIEYCTDFRVLLHLTGGRPPHVLDIQGVSKKGQRVVAMLRNPNQLLAGGKPLNLVDDVQRVELRFSAAIDLINRLLSSFKELGRRMNWSDTYDLNVHLPDCIRFLFGPPGTGKTTNLARGIISRLEKHPNTRLVALTPTNKAADELANKIIKENGGTAPAWLVRYGATFSDSVLENGCLYDRNTFALDHWPGLVLITTVHRYPYEEVNRRPTGHVGDVVRLCDIPWDGLWLDEASMLALPYAVFAMHQRASLNSDSAGIEPAEFVIGGDPQQIPPVLNIRDEDLPAEFDKEQNIYSMVGLSSFDPAEQRTQTRYWEQVENLTIQYRSTPHIGELFSQFTYKGLLAHGRKNGQGGLPEARPLPQSFRQLLSIDHDKAGITLLRFPVNSEESLYRPGKLRLSPYHPYSALLTLELVRRLAQDLTDEAERTGEPIQWTVGVVCPYRIQATLVNKMVESLTLPPGLTVLVDTVHGFQGGECDMILFLLSPTNENGQITRVENQFLHKHYLVNVSISRARDHLIILYPDLNTIGIANLYKLDQRSQGSIESILRDSLKLNLNRLTVQATSVEEGLFGKGQEKYIETNCLTQGHEQVNMYSVPLAQYIFRASSSAVDVQFRQ